MLRFAVTWFALIVVSWAVWCLRNLILEWWGMGKQGMEWPPLTWSPFNSSISSSLLRLHPPHLLQVDFVAGQTWKVRDGFQPFKLSNLHGETTYALICIGRTCFCNIASASSLNCSSEAYTLFSWHKLSTSYPVEVMPIYSWGLEKNCTTLLWLWVGRQNRLL